MKQKWGLAKQRLGYEDKSIHSENNEVKDYNEWKLWTEISILELISYKVIKFKRW